MRLSARLLSSAVVSIFAAFTLAPTALADSIQLSVNTSVVADLDSPNDNYWGGIYQYRGGSDFHRLSQYSQRDVGGFFHCLAFCAFGECDNFRNR